MVSYHYFRFYSTFEISIHFKTINQTTNAAGIATRYVKEWKKTPDECSLGCMAMLTRSDSI